MKYPRLVPDFVCTTPISITIEGEGIDEDGAPNATYELTGLMCNWQDGGKTVYDAEGKSILISGTAYFNGDIAPELPNITGGIATIHGEEREILQGFKRRDVDGTVNYTEIRFK